MARIFKLKLAGCPVPVYVAEGHQATKSLTNSKIKRLWWSDFKFRAVMKTLKTYTDKEERLDMWRAQWGMRARELNIPDLVEASLV